MTARPILFSAPMIRALLEGRKTVTRRIVKPQPSPECIYLMNGAGDHALHRRQDDPDCWVPTPPKYIDHRLPCPYGKPGDFLYVREAWSFDDAGEFPDGRQCIHFEYLADGAREWVAPEVMPKKMRKYPSIHMPRWASRLTLELTGVRVERLQDISEEDAIAEGIQVDECGHAIHQGDDIAWGSAKGAYAELWESINGHGSWAANPWVWALSFRVHCCNIDDHPMNSRVTKERA